MNICQNVCHSERRRSFACERSSRSRNLLFAFAPVYLLCVFVAAFFPTLVLAQELPKGWRRPTRSETSDVWRRKSPSRFVRVNGDLDGDGKTDVVELLVDRSGQQCALFVWLSSQSNKPPEPIWQVDKGGLGKIGIRLLHPGKYETICSSDPSECDPQTPRSVKLKNYGIEFFSHGATRSFAYWDGATKKFRWVPIGD
jgi:hypothetical protein